MGVPHGIRFVADTDYGNYGIPQHIFILVDTDYESTPGYRQTMEIPSVFILVDTDYESIIGVFILVKHTRKINLITVCLF